MNDRLGTKYRSRNGRGFVEVKEGEVVGVVNNHEVADVPKRKDW